MVTISIPGTFIALAGAALLALLVGAFLKTVDWMLSRDRDIDDVGGHRSRINVNASGPASRPEDVASRPRAA